MFSLFFILTFEFICIILILWMLDIVKRSERLTDEIKLSYGFIRGTVRGIMGEFYSDEMLEQDRKLVNSKKSKI